VRRIALSNACRLQVEERSDLDLAFGKAKAPSIESIHESLGPESAGGVPLERPEGAT